MFTEADLDQISSKGLTVEEIEEQLQSFRTGFPYLEIHRPATPGDGIIQVSKNEEESFIESFENKKSRFSILKFVPASGAASRMFKTLFEFIEDSEKSETSDDLLKKYPDVKEIFENLSLFAFKSDLDRVLEKEKTSVETLLNKQEYALLLQKILSSSGLNYGFLPKGLIKFHHYTNVDRTPMEEHFVEGALYAKDSNDEAHFHFTVSPEHKALFEDRMRKTLPEIIERYDGKFKVGFSFQKKSTDTIAVDMKNKPFREAKGELLFRPGGHGALVENLNDVQEEIVFIKNIDNIAPDRLKEPTIRYKKILGGVLLNYQTKIFEYLEKLDDGIRDKDFINEVREFLQDDLNIESGSNMVSAQNEIEYLRKKLNRPIRVCGMVRNLGEPGGGPFIVKNPDGTASPQIVETSQINLELKENQELLEKATHFNPVDLVCALRNYKGEKFNLLDYRDMNTGFISQKSKDGRDLKALGTSGTYGMGQCQIGTQYL